MAIQKCKIDVVLISLSPRNSYCVLLIGGRMGRSLGIYDTVAVAASNLSRPASISVLRESTERPGLAMCLA